MDWGWVVDNRDLIGSLLVEHIWLSAIPVVLGLALALVVGVLAHTYRWAYPPLLVAVGVLYTIPSLALFIVLPVLLGTQILNPLNIVIALTIYSGALLVRTVVDGLDTVPEAVRQAAVGLGYRRFPRIVTVELPIAIPVIIAGLRVVTVANISMVSVGALIGIGGLGELFTSGFQIRFVTEIVVGLALSLLLAVSADALLVLAQHRTTPWDRLGRTA
ncbi:MAG: ABC transporter permease subunit [Actinomycetota bacterium]|nr:ABC transporter permease subunit [Actinomycetota bacterium]